MSRVAIAFDLGGTKLEGALVDEHGAVRPGSRARVTTGREMAAADLADAIAAVFARAEALIAPDDELIGVGVGSAGPIDAPTGTIFPVNMPALHGFPLRETVSIAAEEQLDGSVPVVIGHDGGCLALAESWLGAAQGAAASLSLVVSTGIGGGFVLDGRPVAGASGNAGHLGQLHTTDGELLERIASGPASVAWAQAQGWTGRSGEELASSAASADPVARAAIERSARAVGFALADAATLLDLDVIAIGGGFSRVSEDYVDLVQRALMERAAHDYARRARVVRTALADEGALIGAAALVLRERISERASRRAR